MMKTNRFILTLAAAALLLPLASAQAGNRYNGNGYNGKHYNGNGYNGCRIKEEKLEMKLAYARAANNHWQVSGLERALEEVRRNCTEPRLQTKNNSKIMDKEEKVRERQLELEEARAKGDYKKIAKRERKLREAQAELEEARAGRY